MIKKLKLWLKNKKHNLPNSDEVLSNFQPITIKTIQEVYNGFCLTKFINDKLFKSNVRPVNVLIQQSHLCVSTKYVSKHLN